jgi:hypothetical protein
MRRTSTLWAAATMLSLATAADNDFAWYAGQGEAGRMGFADSVATILKQAHPRLSGYYMKGCLDDLARFPSNRTLSLRFAAVTCTVNFDN